MAKINGREFILDLREIFKSIAGSIKTIGYKEKVVLELTKEEVIKIQYLQLENGKSSNLNAIHLALLAICNGIKQIKDSRSISFSVTVSQDETLGDLEKIVFTSFCKK